MYLKNINKNHSTTKMKTVDAKLTTYINSIKEINDEDPKFKIGDIGRISTYKIFLQYATFQIGCEEVSLIKKVKKTVPWAYINGVVKGQEIAGKFHKKELQKQIKKSLELKK